MKRFLAEIKQRGVHRVAGLYVALVWLLMQASEILFPVFGIPETSLRYFLAVAVAGLPVALALGWFFEITDQGIKLEEDVESSDATRVGMGRNFYGLIISLLALALITSLFVNMRQAAQTPQVVPENISILIADMNNSTGDSVFDGALEQALGIGLEGAPFITSFNRDKALKIAALISDGKTLNAERARLVALREGISLVLSGSITTFDAGFELKVAAVEPAGGEVWVAADTRAETKLDVLAAIGALAVKVREGLGEVSPAEDLDARETFSAASLEAVSLYTRAQTLAANRDDAAAVDLYRQAIVIDPGFGRAYSGWALSEFNLGRGEKSEQLWGETLALLDDMGKRERYRTLGLYYTLVSRNYAKAIENYELLVKHYPADAVGHSNLAVNYFYNRQFDKALQEGGNILALYPNNPIIHSNYALYAMYAGNFPLARDEGQKLLQQAPDHYMAHLPIAMANLAEGNITAASAGYRAMAQAGARGASLAQTGLADIALLQQQHAVAIELLTAALAVDQERGNSRAGADKLIALAQAYQALGSDQQVQQALSQALELSGAMSHRIQAARLYTQLGQLDEAEAIAVVLAQSLQIESRAGADLIRGNIRLAAGDHGGAIEALAASLQKTDAWLTRFDLGRAYFAAGDYAQALLEFEQCQQRLGEATSIFLDDSPTFHYSAQLQDWLLKTRQKSGVAAS
jgi:tetratricopeptide (TPR) repeat protein